MENEKQIKIAELTKDNDQYILSLKIDKQNEAKIIISDSEQTELNTELSKLVNYCIENGANFEFKISISSSIDNDKDVGVIRVAEEYLLLLNSDINTIQTKWLEENK